MSKYKGRNLLGRISNLIFIHVLFVFAALAIILFYPQEETNPEKYYNNLAARIQSSADHIAQMLMPVEQIKSLPPSTITAVNKYINERDFIARLDVIIKDPETGQKEYFNFGSGESDQYWRSHTVIDPENIAIKSTNDKIMPVPILSRNGRTVYYIVYPDNTEQSCVFAFSSPNLEYNPAQSTQAYLLLILFLVAALISLLIMNLISKGIRRPLRRLKEGFEQVSSGVVYRVEESGDKEMQEIIKAFNDMVANQANRKKQVEKANRDLLKANQSLADSEIILTALIDYSPDAIIVTDLDDQVIIYNNAAAREFGFGQYDMMGKKIDNLIPVAKESTSGVIEGINDSQEVICQHKNGSRFPAVLVRTPLGVEGKKPMAMLHFVRSISESENYQEMILELDRAASRGKMARDIAHEINNYLAVLQGNLELIPMFLSKGDTEKVEKKAAVMRDTVDKISTFTEGLTRYSDASSEFSKEDLSQLIENLIAFLKPQNKFDDVSIISNLSEDVPLVEIDAGQMQLLLVNLINNAAEAQAAGEGQRWVAISTEFNKDSASVIIKVADPGRGVDEEHIPQLFKKRFTTKRDNTGLGLITSKSIIDNHSGTIAYRRTEDNHSVFIFSIPVKSSQDNSQQSGNTDAEKVPGLVK